MRETAIVQAQWPSSMIKFKGRMQDEEGDEIQGQEPVKTREEEEWSVLDKPRILDKQLLEGRSGWEG